MRRTLRITSVALILLALLATTFGTGVAVGGSDLLAGPIGTLLGHEPALATSEPVQLDTFWEVWDLVHDHFIDRETLGTTELEYGAIQGMVSALGDEGHTTFLTPEELARHQSDISGRFAGIGALVGVKDGLPVIITPFDSSPAELAGIKAGDLIMEVDGQDVTSWSLGEVVDRIRGEEGTEVVLTILRPDLEQSLEIPITRGEISVAAATWAMVPGTDVALIRLSRFSASADEEMAAAIREAKAAGATGLILDVRNNPGGLLDQAIRVTSQFLEDGNVLQEEDAQGHRKAYPVKQGGLATEIPLVVLTNQGTASSAEIFAGAIQDHGRGLVVGETTFGTGTVLRTFTLNDGSALMLGTSQWLTADGRLIRKQGIEPDIVVELPAGAQQLLPGELEGLTPTEVLDSGDNQMLRALELLEAPPATVGPS